MTATTPTTIEARIEELTPTIQQIALRFSTDEVPADDIYQGIIEKILLSCKPTDTRSFICQCATWHAKNMLCSERIYKQYVGSIFEEETEDGEEYDIIELSVSNEPAPEEWVLRREMATAICELMAGVNDKNREILALLAQGETHQEIADRLKVTRTAVTNRVRAIRGAFSMAGIIPV